MHSHSPSELLSLYTGVHALQNGWTPSFTCPHEHLCRLR